MMSDAVRPLDSYPFNPPFPSSPQKLSPDTAEHASTFSHAHNALPSDFQFDPSGLAGSPEHPQNHDMPASWTSVDSQSHTYPLVSTGFVPSQAFSMVSSAHASPIMNRRIEDMTASYGGTSSFTPMTDYHQPSIPSHVLSHASSSSSLASLASSHDFDAGRLLVQTFPPDQIMDISPTISVPHSRHSSFSSLTMPYEQKMFEPSMAVPAAQTDMSMNMYQPFHDPVQPSQYVPTGEVFVHMNPTRQQQPRLAVQTQGLGKVTRERSASRSTPYSRYRSESLSAKSEEADEMASMVSASTTYSSQTPWSATTSGALNGGLNRITLHHRRTSSNLSSTPFQSPVSRPMLSRARRSTSFVLSKQQSHQDLSGNAAEIRLSGSAIERQETVRRDLTDKAEEIKRLSSTSQQDKARGIWVRRWLVLSYTHTPGRTVPRQGLYHSYTISCEEYGLKPINSASFGKAVRSAYPGIKTRRLGVRGNSKYHYVSIRPAIQIEAERLNEFGDSSDAWHVAPEDGSMDFRASAQAVEEEMEGDEMDESEDEDELFSTGTLKKSPSAFDIRATPGSSSASISRATSINDAFSSRPRFPRRHTTAALSGPSSQSQINPTTINVPAQVEVQVQVPIFNSPSFPTLANVGEAVSERPMDEVSVFWNAFCHHQEMLVGCVRGLHFDRFEVNCRTFWASLSPVSRQLCNHPTISTMISDATAVTYDHMIGILLGKLNASIAAQAQTALRGLVENLETIMEGCFATFPREFSEAKIELAVRAAHLFIRFLDLHQLSAALSPIFANPLHTQDMMQAWETLDIHNVSDQCALSCSCQQDILEQVLADFGNWLNEVDCASSSSRARDQKSGGVAELGKWVDRMIEKVRASVPSVTLRAITCRVAFVTSQVMRDFTLKSEKSFGLFQLIKTWIDDYVSIHSLRQTALSTSSVEAAGAEESSFSQGQGQRQGQRFGAGHGGRFSSSSGSSISSMSVFIPGPRTNSIREDSTDLSTAVPFVPGSTGALQPNLGGYESRDGESRLDNGDGFGSGSGDGVQYLPVPAFGVDSEMTDSIVTPRPGMSNFGAT